MALKPGLAATLARAPRIADWLALEIDATGTRRWTVRTGKVEIGQGIHTALRQIAASALGEALDRVQVAPVTTAGSRDEGTTSGSRSIEEGGALIHGA
ncbi:MAG: molybdopterin cofactor-binding domain-containing protein, partial [Caldimonas sp.]